MHDVCGPERVHQLRRSEQHRARLTWLGHARRGARTPRGTGRAASRRGGLQVPRGRSLSGRCAWRAAVRHGLHGHAVRRMRRGGHVATARMPAPPPPTRHTAPHRSRSSAARCVCVLSGARVRRVGQNRCSDSSKACWPAWAALVRWLGGCLPSRVARFSPQPRVSGRGEVDGVPRPPPLVHTSVGGGGNL